MMKKRIVKDVKPVTKQEVTRKVSNPMEELENELIAANPYKMGYTIEDNDISKSVYCPLVYVNDYVSRYPSPFDAVLKNIEDIKNRYMMSCAMEDEHIVNNDTVKSALRYEVMNAVSSSYDAALTGMVESYFEQNLVPKFSNYTYDDNGNICLVRNIIEQIGYRMAHEQSLCYLVREWWKIWDAEGYNDMEKTNSCYYCLSLKKDQLGSMISTQLSSLARTISFGESMEGYRSTLPINEITRDTIISNATEGADKENAQEFYATQLSEYTLIVDGILPLIEVLLSQCYTTFKYFYFNTSSLDTAFSVIGEF